MPLQLKDESELLAILPAHYRPVARKQLAASQFHPLANIFPLADHGPEFEAFVEDIKCNGLLQPIVLHEGMILDGRRRYLACQQAGVSPDFSVWDGIGMPVDFVISTNALRRHLSPSQLAIAALKSLPFFQKASKDASGCPRVEPKR